jgi:hypothetical protein
MILNYASLVILLAGLTLVFYVFIYIHDIPYQVAKKKNHPQAQAIHVACWLSLFTLHAIWPIVFIWAIIDHGPIPITLRDGVPGEGVQDRLAALEKRIRELEGRKS